MPELITSPSDDREYRLLQLPNELMAILISDPDTDTSAASLNVNAGAALDQAEHPGTAHFLEHMLF